MRDAACAPSRQRGSLVSNIVMNSSFSSACCWWRFTKRCACGIVASTIPSVGARCSALHRHQSNAGATLYLEQGSVSHCLGCLRPYGASSALHEHGPLWPEGQACETARHAFTSALTVLQSTMQADKGPVWTSVHAVGHACIFRADIRMFM